MKFPEFYQDLIADVFLLFGAAVVALDITTPDEAAVTLLLDLLDTGLVTTTTAEQSAAVQSWTAEVAEATPCAQHTQPAQKPCFCSVKMYHF